MENGLSGMQSGINALLLREHFHEFLDAGGAGFGLLRGLDAEEDGVAILAVQ